MSGLIVINKPSGYTSRATINVVAQVLKTKKVGHTGTLDPLATGVLVVTIGKYTKLTEMLTSLEKEYIAEIKLGIETDTLDITGNIIATSDNRTTKEDVIKVLASFVGEYQMEVPKYSAIKVKGKKLYEYARSGEEVTLPIKTVHIYELELLSFTSDTITFRARVEKGTYIRSLIRDITKELHTIGVMSNLVRTKQGNFSLENAYSLEDIKNYNYQILTARDVLDIPVYSLNEAENKIISNGGKIALDLETEMVLFTYQDKEIAIYQKDKELYKPKVMLI